MVEADNTYLLDMLLLDLDDFLEKKGFGATPQFYLIVGSFKEFESANSEMKKVRLKGYPSAFILYQEPLYRIVISSSEDSEKASRLKNELKETFPGIWVFKK